jgi:hypothetical protein
MANPNRRGGVIFLKVSGTLQDAKGNFTYNLGVPKREAIVGAATTHGYKELAQVAFIEGEITDRSNLDVKALMEFNDETVTLELANGKVIALRNAWYAGDGNIGTDEGNIAVRFEGLSAEEVL